MTSTRLGRELGGGLGLDELGLPGGEGGVHAAARLPDELAGRGLVGRGDVAQLGVEPGERASPRRCARRGPA